MTAGVSADLIRISVGIENIDDILANVEQALESIYALKTNNKYSGCAQAHHLIKAKYSKGI